MTSERGGRWKRRTLAAALVGLAGLVALGGCVTERKDGRAPAGTARPVKRTTGGPALPAEDVARPGGKPNELTDPCATRLHDLSGLLLLYYATNKRLPETLDELSSLTDFDMEFRTDCPVSGRPYVYAPAATPPPGSDQFLVLYDSVPAHRGLRWGVFILPPRDQQLPATKVILMTETVFRNYVPRGGGRG
jgi:hypothetical protein